MRPTLPCAVRAAPPTERLSHLYSCTGMTAPHPAVGSRAVAVVAVGAVAGAPPCSHGLRRGARTAVVAGPVCTLSGICRTPGTGSPRATKSITS
jgi:hypothetical protein